MIISIDEKSIRSRLKKVSPQIQGAFWSYDLAELAGLAASKRALPDSITRHIGKISGLVLLGFLPIKDAPAQLAEAAMIGPDVAASIFADLMLFFNPLMPQIQEAQKLGTDEAAKPAADILKPLQTGDTGPLYEKETKPTPAPVSLPVSAPAPIPAPAVSAYAMPTAAPVLPSRAPGVPIVPPSPKGVAGSAPANAKALEPFIMRQNAATAPVQVDTKVANIAVQGAGFTAGDQMREMKGASLPPPPKPVRLEIGAKKEPAVLPTPAPTPSSTTKIEESKEPADSYIRKSFILKTPADLPSPPKPARAPSPSPFVSSAAPSYIPPAPVSLGSSPVAVPASKIAVSTLSSGIKPVPLPPIPPPAV